MTSYLPYCPQQKMLLPQALQEWLPEAHLTYLISDAVDGLGLSAFHARYAEGRPRNQPFHPAMMVKLGTVAIDGTKVKANASRHKAMSYGHMVDQLRDPALLFCVGDDAQSIYRFRGADFKNILDFRLRVPGATVLKLEDNYRSTQELLDLSNWLLDRSPVGYDKRLRAVRGKGNMPVMREFRSDWSEADWIAEDLQERYRGGAKWADHMILVRSAWSGRGVERALLAKEVPYRFIGGVKLLESAHVRDVLAVLRLLANHRDDLAWMRFLQLYPKIGEVTAEKMATSFVEVRYLEEAIADLRRRATQLGAAADLLDKLHGAVSGN